MKVFNTSLLLVLVALLLPINPGDSCYPSGGSTSYHEPTPPQSPHIISRQEWGARSPRDITPMILPVEHVTVHHSDTGGCDNEYYCSRLVSNIQRFHMYTKNWDDIAYNFLIGGDGSIYEGRGWNREGEHAGNTEYNENGFGICMMGDFDNSSPTPMALQALEQLLEYAEASNKLTFYYNLLGHRDVRDFKLGPTPCPGEFFYRNEVVNMRHYGYPSI